MKGYRLLVPVLLLGVAAQALGADAARFDLNVTDAPAQIFFRGLVDGTPTNLLVDQQVSGRITLQLKNVTLDEALEAVRDLYGYDVRRTAAGYLVLPAAIQTRTYHMNYLALQRYGVSKTRISSGQITQGDNTQYSGGSAVASTSASAAAGAEGDGKATIDVSGTAVVTRMDSDFWSALERDLKLIVGDQPGRNLVINRQSGLVMARALPRELRDVEDYLRLTTETVTRQVIIEAKIVEVELSDAYQAGINWANVLTRGSTTLLLGQSAPPGGFDANPLAPGGSPVTLGPGHPITALASSTLGGAFTLAADTADFNAFIELLAAQGQTHVLSSPRVSTLNNQKAIIKAGTDEFFVTGVTSNTVTGTATSTTRDVQLTPFFSGVALDVTPQIGPDNRVLLHIHPTISDVTDQVKTLTMSGTTDTLPLALSQIRESDDIVEAQSGQLIVIGGLMRQTRQDRNYRTPILGDVPLLGKLFRSERQQSRTVELVILLRPVVVSTPDWEALVGESTSRIDALRRKARLQ